MRDRSPGVRGLLDAPDVNVHDPFITQEGSDWYVFSTGPRGERRSSS
ncbi:MAG TPA: hypothetical protein VK524_26760 [Polyangiaceae bacterium]|nr:hypothetical protein [Polyangiaceae bacterium]